VIGVRSRRSRTQVSRRSRPAVVAEYLHRYLDLARQVREQRARIAAGDDDLVQELGDPDRWIRSRAT
jgi:hypothetical protein